MVYGVAEREDMRLIQWSMMLQNVDERLVLDNVVSIMEHSVVHISHPSEAFLEQVETDVVRLMLYGSCPVSVHFVFRQLPLFHSIPAAVMLYVTVWYVVLEWCNVK